MSQLNSHQFEGVYKDLGINLDTLGCIMLDVEPVLGARPKEEYLYYTKDKEKFWIDGYVFEKYPHLTLLYGLMDTGKNWEKYVKAVLEGWKIETVEIDSIGYFNSPYKNELYYCIVAFPKVTDELMEGHQRLEFLPHVNTFTGYKPHITLAYVYKLDDVRETVMDMFSNLVGTKLPVKQINLGGKP